MTVILIVVEKIIRIFVSSCNTKQYLVVSLDKIYEKWINFRVIK